MSFFGDGAANIGSFHEGINFAAVRKAPVVFVCENNLYAASTHMSLTTGIIDIAERAKSYGIPGRVVDGMDVIAVYRSAAEAVASRRAGEGPTLLEYKTYRYPGHSRGDPGNYRNRQEMEEWRRRDPIDRLRALLMAEFGIEPRRPRHDRSPVPGDGRRRGPARHRQPRAGSLDGRWSTSSPRGEPRHEPSDRGP